MVRMGALALCLAALVAFASAVQLPKPQTPMTENDNPFYAAATGTLAGPPRNTYGESAPFARLGSYAGRVAGFLSSICALPMITIALRQSAGTQDLLEDSPFFAKPANADTPDQVCFFYDYESVPLVSVRATTMR